MPQGYRNNSLAANPYVGIDVDYFDRKALEKQQKHDLARENYSKFAQDIANQSYLDPDSRNEYLKQQQQEFENVINKHSGNLSAGYQDILGAIEKSKFSPYHNLNKRHIEQEQLRQSLVSQYGAEAIDLSQMPNKLYNRKAPGEPLEWVNPNSIGAKVIKADDYDKVIEDMLKETSAYEYSTQSGIGGGSGDPFYLMSRITKGKVLSPQDLWLIASNKKVQESFLANASTSGLDNRKVSGQNYTYKEMFTDPNKLANFIYGNIQDKQINNQFQSKQFVANRGLELSTQHSNRLKADKAQTDYQAYVKKIEEAGYTFNLPLENKAFTGESINQIKTQADKNKAKESQLSSQVYSKTKEFNDILGFAPQPGKNYTFGDIVEFKTSDNKLDRKKVQIALNKKYGLDENANLEGISPDIKTQMEDDLVKIDNKFMELQHAEKDRRNELMKLEDKNNLLSTIDESVNKQVFEILSQNSSTNNELKRYGINSIKDMQDFLIKNDNDPQNPFKLSSFEIEKQSMRDKIISATDEIKNKGVELDQVYSALVNESDKASSNRWNRTLSDNINKVGFEKVLGMFVNEDGKDLASFTMLSRDRSALNPRRYFEGNSISLNDRLKDLKASGHTFKLESFLASPDSGKGLKQHLKIKVFYQDKELTDQELFLPNVGLSPEYNNVSAEISMGMQTEAYNGYLVNPNYKKENISRANIQTGQTIAGDAINDAVGDLSNENIYKKDYFVPFNLVTGEQTGIKIYKDIDGYYGLIGIDGQVVKASDDDMPYKTKTIGEIRDAASDLIGEAYYRYNPNVNTEIQRVPRSTFSNSTSYGNYAFSKRDFSGISNEEPQGESENDVE